MEALGHSQLDALNRAILHLHEPVAFQHFHERAFEAAAMAVRADVVGFSAMNVRTRQADSFLSVAATGPMCRFFDHLDDFYAMPGVADGAYFSTAAPTSMHDFIALDAFKGRAIYEFFYKEVDVVYDLCLNFHASSGSAFCALQLARKRPFTDGERRMLHLFQPHVGQRYRQLLAVERNNPLASLMAQREQGWLICNDAGAIRARSPTLPEILRELEGAVHLPEDWMPWLRRELHPPSANHVPRPLLIERRRQRVAVHCLPNRFSGEHRLVLEPISLAPDALSRREREIARWMAAGKTNSEIADILHISPHTAKTHVQRILSKLGVENRTSAAAALLAAGLLE